MPIHSDDSDGPDFGDGSGWWSGDEKPLDHLLKYVGPGSRLVYEYRPTARFGGQVTWFDTAPVIGIVRYAENHEIITGVYFVSQTKRCLLNYAELTGLIRFLQTWFDKTCCPTDDDRPRVQRIRHESRNGLTVEWNDQPGPAIALISVASPVIVGLTGKELERLLRELQRLQAFLEEVRE